jgi:glycerol-3-phosphate acyltransferase PlsX
MGGDRAPDEIVAGAQLAAAKLGIRVLLVGDPDRMGDTGELEVLPASEVIEMDDEPGTAVRTKKDSSLVRAAEAVRDGQASAMVSAGNTGAAMASALLRLGRLPKVARPAIATPIPVPGSTPTVLLDAGANADCQPQWLAQFGQMGTVFSRARFGVPNPRVALLSIGEEDSKGNQLVKDAHKLLREADHINFIGNVEGRDFLRPTADVVVTDGFTGNVVLKTLEGGVGYMVEQFKRLAKSLASEQAGPGIMAEVAPLLQQLDPNTYGGAMLLGVNGVCIISHGSSSSNAIANAIGVAHDMVEGDVVGQLREAVSVSAD